MCEVSCRGNNHRVNAEVNERRYLCVMVPLVAMVPHVAIRDSMIGALFLLAIACYATGSGMTESAVVNGDDRHAMASGALLMLLNSVCVSVIGVLMHPILHVESENVALGYVVVRCTEGVLLSVGIVCLLSQQALTEVENDAAADVIRAVLQTANFFAYQMAMCVLGLGSLPVCATFLRSRLLPAWLSLLGLVGYAIFLVGAIAEIFGSPVGVMLSAPAGLFEIALPLWLFTKGFARDVHRESLT